MSNFSGGSAAVMARQVAGGEVPVTQSLLERLSAAELGSFAAEVERLRREVGGEPAGDDPGAVRERNLRIERLNTCRMLLVTYSRQAGTDAS